MCSLIPHLLHNLNNDSGHPVVRGAIRQTETLSTSATCRNALRLTYVFVQLQVTFLQIRRNAILSAIDIAVDVGHLAGKGRSNTILHATPANFPELRVEPPELPPRLSPYLKALKRQ